jgi:predicted Zn-dependent protease
MKWSKHKWGLASAAILALMLLAAPSLLNRIAQPDTEEATDAAAAANSLSDPARQAEVEAQLQWIVSANIRAPIDLSDEAIERELRPALLELVEKYPDDYQSHHLAGIVAVRFKQTQVAEPRLRRSLELAPDDSQIRLDLADMLLQIGNNDEALELLEAGATGGANSPHYLHSLAEAQLRSGDARRASLTLLDATQRFPDSEPNWLSLGKAQLQLGEYAPAEASLRTAIALNPDNKPNWIALSQALAFQRKTEAAAQVREELKRLGDGTEATDSFDSVFSASLRRFACSSFRSLAVVYQRHLDGVRAKHWLDRARQIDPTDVLTLAYLTSYYRNTGEFAAAAEVMRELLLLEPHALHNYVNLANLQMEQGNTAGAEAALRLAVERGVEPKKSLEALNGFLQMLAESASTGR